MGSFKESLSDEERAFLDSNLHKGGKRDKDRGPKCDFHRWGKPGETSTHYFTILYVPEIMREEFGGIIPLPKRTLMHRNVRLFSKGNSGGNGNSLFPKAQRSNVPHFHDDNLCHVCKRIEPIRTQLEEAESNGNTDLARKLKMTLGSSAKWRRAWIGEAFYEIDKKWERKIEIFELADYYWDLFLVSALLKPRGIDIDDWKMEHENEIQGMSDADILDKFNDETPPKYPLPWDFRKGYKIRAIKTGAQKDTKYEIEKRQTFPYKTFKVPEKFKGKKGYDEMVALAKTGKANFEYLKGLFAAGLVPDLNQHYNDNITLDEQAVMLGLHVEEKGSSITSNDDTVTVGNKLDGKRARVEISSEKSESSTDDMDLNLDDEDEPFPKSPPTKAPKATPKAGKKKPKPAPVPEPEEEEEDEEEEDAIVEKDDDDDLDLTLDDDDLADLT